MLIGIVPSITLETSRIVGRVLLARFQPMKDFCKQDLLLDLCFEDSEYLKDINSKSMDVLGKSLDQSSPERSKFTW